MYRGIIYYLPLLFGFSFAYSVTFSSWIFKYLLSYEGSHSPVIVAMSFYMIWTKRMEIKKLEITPGLLGGTGLTVAGCFMLIAGRLSGLLLLQYLSLIITLLGLIWLIWGLKHLKVLFYPIAYFIFVFPLFSVLLEGFSIYFQLFTSWIAYNLLYLTGIPVLRSAQFIELPNITLEVARECNGVNHIMALVGLAIPLAYWSRHTWQRKIILIISAFFIGIIANGLRVAIIGFLSAFSRGVALHGPYDTFYVSFIFFFGMALLIGLNFFMMKKRSEETVTKESISREKKDAHKLPLSLSPVVIAALILIVTGSYLLVFKPKPIHLSKPMAEFPVVIGNWKGYDAAFTKPPFKFFSADTELKRVYHDNNGREIKLYIGYFLLQEQDREVVHYRFDSLHYDASVVQIPLEGKIIEVKRVINNRMDLEERIYFWYDINGTILTNRYAAKLATILDALVYRRTNAAIIVLSASHQPRPGLSADEDYDIKFIEEIFPIIQNHLKAKAV